MSFLEGFSGFKPSRFPTPRITVYALPGIRDIPIIYKEKKKTQRSELLWALPPPSYQGVFKVVQQDAI
jgi:hypothetical protein